MTRTVSNIITAASNQDNTTPVYLIYMAWDVASPDQRYICTWDTAITWNSIVWAPSGASVDNLSVEGGSLVLPNGDADPWLALVHADIPRDRVAEVYEHHTSTASPAGSDAELLFTGRMDGVTISDRGIKIDLIEGRTNKGFPPTSIGVPVYNYLLPPGTKLAWGTDSVVLY